MSRPWRRWLPRWLGGGRGAEAYVATGPAGTIDLRFARGVAQSRMRRNDPDWLVVDYTRTMLASLLWQPSPTRVGVVGLGGGSQVKFLHRHFPQASIEAVEISAEVLAIRAQFRIPPDDARLTVRHADAATFLPEHPQRYDLMLVDAYDASGIPAALSTKDFHIACRNALTDGGVLASNLYCDDHVMHFDRLREAFDGRVLLVEEIRQSNRVAFAWREGARLHDAEALLQSMSREAAVQLQRGMRRVTSAMRRAGPKQD